MSQATTTEHAHDDHGHSEGDHGPHVVSWQLLTIIFLSLMVLTILTVAAINIDLGPLNIFVALGIAFLKAALVVLFFMHIWWDRAFHGLLIIGSFGFAALFIGFTMLDTWQYESNITAQDVQAAHDAAHADSPNYTPPPALIEDAH